MAPTLLQPAERRPELGLRLVETQLGTPEGAPAVAPSATNLTRAEESLAAWRAHLDPETIRYLEGRLDLARGRRAPGHARLASVTGPLFGRARLFAALSAPSEVQRRAALAELPGSGPVWLARLRFEGPDLAGSLPSGAPDFAADAWGWLIWASFHPEKVSNPDEARARVADLAADLLASNRPDLLERVQYLADRLGWPDIQVRLRSAWLAAQRRRAAADVRRGRRAGAQGDFDTARNALSRALDLGAPKETWKLYLVALIETGASAAELDQARARMRFAGYSTATINALISRAHAGRARANESVDLVDTPTRKNRPAP